MTDSREVGTRELREEVLGKCLMEADNKTECLKGMSCGVKENGLRNQVGEANRHDLLRYDAFAPCATGHRE